jgi:predicted MFS family arabinose efflux permease
MVRASYLLTATSMTAGFAIIPNISAYVQGNLGYPRSGLMWLYFVGGLASYLAIRLVGGLVDRFGSFRVGSAGAALLFLVITFFFYASVPGLPPMLMFVAMMTAMAFRNVAHTTLTSKVPAAAERARFQAIQSAVQHAASAAGAFLSAKMLTTEALVDAQGRAGTRLVGMPKVALLAMALTAVLPLLFRRVENAVRQREATARLAGVPD